MSPYGYQGYPQMQNNPYLQQSYNPYMQMSNEVISGAVVDSEDVVRGKNCSLDGSATYYPLADQSAIFVKKLNPQTGAGMLMRYSLDIPKEQSQIPVEQLISDFKSEVFKEINELKNIVLESATAPTQKDANSFMNKPRNGGN